MVIRLFLVAAFTLATALPCPALRQYRCDGRVQYRPCETKPEMTDEGTAAVSHQGKARWTRIHPGTRKEPRVFEDTFEKANEGEGIWRGQVAGNGLVHLSLYIYRRGRLQTQRYMGAVELNEETTYFAFKTVIPHGDDWTWVIKAHSS